MRDTLKSTSLVIVFLLIQSFLAIAGSFRAQVVSLTPVPSEPERFTSVLRQLDEFDGTPRRHPRLITVYLQHKQSEFTRGDAWISRAAYLRCIDRLRLQLETRGIFSFGLVSGGFLRLSPTEFESNTLTDTLSHKPKDEDLVYSVYKEP